MKINPLAYSLIFIAAQPYFNDIYQLIGVHWKELARKLGFEQTAIDTIFSIDPRNANEQCSNMLNFHQLKSGNSFTKLQLVKALISAGLREVAETCNLYKIVDLNH